MSEYVKGKDFDFNFILKLSKILNVYGFSFSKEFNQICLSLQVVNKVGETLCKKENLKRYQDEIIESFNQINKLFEI